MHVLVLSSSCFHYAQHIIQLHASYWWPCQGVPSFNHPQLHARRGELDRKPRSAWWEYSPGAMVYPLDFDYRQAVRIWPSIVRGGRWRLRAPLWPRAVELNILATVVRKIKNPQRGINHLIRVDCWLCDLFQVDVCHSLALSSCWV